MGPNVDSVVRRACGQPVRERNTRPRAFQGSVYARLFAPEDQRVLDGLGVVPRRTPATANPNRSYSCRAGIVRPPHLERRPRARPAARLRCSTCSAAPMPTPCAPELRQHRQVVDVELVEHQPERAEADDAAVRRRAPGRQNETPRFSSSARYISRVQGLVNDACLDREDVVDLVGGRQRLDDPGRHSSSSQRSRLRLLLAGDLRIGPPDVQRLHARPDRPSRLRAPRSTAMRPIAPAQRRRVAHPRRGRARRDRVCIAARAPSPMNTSAARPRVHRVERRLPDRRRPARRPRRAAPA